MSDPNAHIVISYERFSEWRTGRRLLGADRTPPPSRPADDADRSVPRDPRPPEPTVPRPI